MLIGSYINITDKKIYGDTIILKQKTDSIFRNSQPDKYENLPSEYTYRIILGSEPRMFGEFKDSILVFTDYFNYLKIRTYKINGNSFDVFCFGHLNYEIDGNYAIYFNKDFGILATSTLSWIYYSIRDTEKLGNKNLKLLIKKMAKDKKFFPIPKWKKKEKIEEINWP